MSRLSPSCLRQLDHGARPAPVSEWVHLYSISSCTIQPSFLSLVFNHTTSASDPVLHLRVRARRGRPPKAATILRQEDELSDTSSRVSKRARQSTLSFVTPGIEWMSRLCMSH